MNGMMKPARTNVASIIAAARRNLKRANSSSSKDHEKNDDDDDDVDEDDNGKDDDMEASNGDSDSAGAGADTSDSDCDSDSETASSSDEDEVDDLNEVNEMQQDMVKHLNRDKTKTKQNGVSVAPVNNVENDSDEDDDDGGDHDDHDSSSDTDDEEAKKEAAKAAKYFDTTDSKNAQDVEVFAQLNLSRPLLRGVASIGFVSPTPIQSRVIPVALSGRDICARYAKKSIHFKCFTLLVYIFFLP